ncbi:AsmA family protein, partial [Crenalkalicoccus roseus]|uniref:AsmA family protein n=1 Tax=Crenalkalicoccus roseus TaxID=1485588 RepID=UPI0010809822
MADPAPAPTRRLRLLRWALLGLALVLLLPVAALALFLATFDAEAQKPRLEAAAEQATGRDVAIAGPVGVKLSLVPTLTLGDVSLANVEGGSRPEMLRVRQVEVQLALLPLLSRRVEVRRLVLDGPDLLLETGAGGRPNWVFAPDPGPAAAPPAAPPPAPAAEAPPARSLAVSVDRLLLREGVVTWRGEGAPLTLGIRRLEAAARAPGGPLRLEGDLALQDMPLALAGEVGPLAALTAPDGAPWPLALALEAEGARLAAEGEVARPALRQGYRLALSARVPDLARFARLVPDIPLPPLRGMEAAAVLADAGGGAPALSGIRLSVGESDLNALHPGLRLLRLAASLPAPDQPVALEAEARVGEAPLALSGTLGPPAPLLAGGRPAQPWPVALMAQAAGATATVEGGIADPRALAGVDLALALRVPDLAALSPLLGAPLPPLRDLSAEARLAERGPGFEGGAILRGLRAAAPAAGDVAGELTYVIGVRPGVTGRLSSRRLDLDTLRAAVAPAPAAPAPAAPAAPPPRDGRLIPDLPLPLEALRVFDADLRLVAAELLAGGATYREVSAHLVVQDGRGRLDPLAATLPGGPVTLRAAADITADPPAVQLAARSDRLDLAPLLAALGGPQGVTGRLELDLDLRGRGRDLRAAAATAQGHLGLAVTEARLPPALLEALLAELRRQVPAVAQLAAQPLAIACLAARLEAEQGVARPRTLFADTSLGRVAGEGAISLRDESLALRLNTDLRLPVPGLGPGGLRIRAPVPLTGTLAAPRPEWGALAGSALAGEAANLAERQLGAAAGQILGQLGGALGGREPAGGLPDCASALRIARGGREGPVPASAAP